MTFHAYSQTIKRIYLNNGIVQQIPLNAIDSMTYVGGSIARLHLHTGAVLQIPFNTIDSVNFLFSSLQFGSVADIEGNTYNTIQIGDQIWMAENLRVSKFRNNSNITEFADALQWSGIYDNKSQTAAWCYYQNDPATNKAYGKLYNWYAVVNINGICPNGWHVPSDQEWTKLTDFLGGESVAAGKMKTVGTVYWNSPNQDATNSSGFSALPGGLRYYFSSFDFISDFGTFWAATQDDAGRSWARYLSYEFANVFRTSSIKENAFSVRCVKD
jgi:uncharacterized protein (TIGR02145 family)